MADMADYASVVKKEDDPMWKMFLQMSHMDEVKANKMYEQHLSNCKLMAGAFSRDLGSSSLFNDTLSKIQSGQLDVVLKDVRDKYLDKPNLSGVEKQMVDSLDSSIALFSHVKSENESNEFPYAVMLCYKVMALFKEKHHAELCAKAFKSDGHAVVSVASWNQESGKYAVYQYVFEDDENENE